jgi:hypothetical protein
MPENVVYIPLRRKLYDDIVRYSDGRVDPAAMAESQLEMWVERDLEFGTGAFWGDRFEEVAAEYAPHLYEHIEKMRQTETAAYREEHKPLVWKEVTVRAGSEVRMSYGDNHHYAKIDRGAIIDDGKQYSPSEWASKVAGGTSRNAWRDLWFRELGSKTWVPAQMLRDQARQEMAARKLGSAEQHTELTSAGGDE